MKCQLLILQGLFVELILPLPKSSHGTYPSYYNVHCDGCPISTVGQYSLSGLLTSGGVPIYSKHDPTMFLLYTKEGSWVIAEDAFGDTVRLGGIATR